jgi:hypothetical protein
VSEAHSAGGACGAIHHENGNVTARGAAGWLSLAAAPTFATMALLTGVFGGGPPDMLCSAAQDMSLLSGMVPMYLLMSAFHSAPWLKLISSRRKGLDPLVHGMSHTASSGTNALPTSEPCSGRSTREPSRSEIRYSGHRSAGGALKQAKR